MRFHSLFSPVRVQTATRMGSPTSSHSWPQVLKLPPGTAIVRLLAELGELVPPADGKIIFLVCLLFAFPLLPLHVIYPATTKL